jgi:hypothetical protein
LSRPGGTRSIIGQGGLLDVGIGIIDDLQAGSVAGVIGAVQKAGTAYNTYKNTSIRSVATEEAIGAVQGVLRGTSQGNASSSAINSLIPANFTQNAATALQRPIFPTPKK